MKCPKCQYIGFDSGERCRNCGYEFSLTTHPLDSDLPIQTGQEPVGPLTDLALWETLPAPGPEHEPALVGAASQVEARSVGVDAERGRAATSPDLPLFMTERGQTVDPALIAPASAPRPPLAVRRGAPGAARRARTIVEEARLNLEPEIEAQAEAEPRPVDRPAPVGPLSGQTAEPETVLPLRPAGAGQRIVAVVVDAVLLSAINLAVLYFTLKVSGLTWQEIALLPLIPFAGYLLLLDGGYSVAFTAAGGQTIGKMAVGIKVVPSEPSDPSDERVPFGQAILRSAAWIVSFVAVGLGFLPALFGADRRGVHDWLAATRVVRA